VENQGQEELVKRQVPLTAMGGAVCSYCIIEKSKNIIGLEMPDILTLPEHDKMVDLLEDHQADELAFKCIETIAKKVGLDEENLTYCRLSSLENQKTFGSLFIGLMVQKMKPDENLSQFRDRIIENYQKMGLIDVEFDSIADPENPSLSRDAQIGLFSDIFFFYSEKQHEDDRDDFDEGSDAGFETGCTMEHFLAKLAIYRCLKNRKIKEIDTFLEDFDSAMENFKVDNGFLAKWTKKYNQEIKDDEE
jgi:hypothetical protein